MVQAQTDDKISSLRVHESTVALVNEVRGYLIALQKHEVTLEDTIIYLVRKWKIRKADLKDKE